MKNVENTNPYLDKFNNTVCLGEEEISLTKEEFDFLESLDIVVGDPDWEEKCKTKEHIDELIMAYFAMSKYKHAWDTIEENLPIIDFKRIRNCQFFRLDPKSTITFKYLHDNNIIDDVEYAYYNVIGGALFDHEFWDKYIEDSGCESFTQVLELINSARNGLSFDDCPPITMVVDDYQYGLMKKYLQDDELLDDYISTKTVIDFPNEVIDEFIKDGHIKTVEFALSVELCKVTTDEEYDAFWKKVNTEFTHMIDYRYINLMTVDDLMYVVNNRNKFSEGHFDTLLVNCPFTPKLINTIKKAVPEFNPVQIEVDHYLRDELMGMVPMLHAVGFSTMHYMTIDSCDHPSFVVYNTSNNHILYGNEVYDYDDFKEKIKIFDEYFDDPEYKYHEMSPHERSLFTTLCESNFMLYNELILAVYYLMRYIDGDE